MRTYLIFGDIEGKLDVIAALAGALGAFGAKHVDNLIEKYGREANLMDVPT
jgi:hypothetical protein